MAQPAEKTAPVAGKDVAPAQAGGVVQAEPKVSTEKAEAAPVSNNHHPKPAETPAKVEAPPAEKKADPPKPEAPKPEAPKAETQAKVEAPKVEAPPAEKKPEAKPEPKPEPKVEAPKAKAEAPAEPPKSADKPKRAESRVYTPSKEADDDAADDNAAQAAHYALLQTKNRKLEEQISALEDQLFEAEEVVMGLQTKLVLAEEDIADVTALLLARETRNDEDRRRLAERQARLDEETMRLDELDAERRAFDSRITVLEAEVEQSTFVQQKLERSLNELESTRKTVAELLEKNAELVEVTERRAREIVDLEKSFTNNVAHQHVLHAKTVGDMEKLLQNERKRAQEALEYVRATLKARIQGLELQLKTMDTTTDSRREKRKMERELKQTLREIDEGKEQATRNARKIEALEKQLEILKPRGESLAIEKLQLETDHHKYTREVRTLHTQLNIIYATNAKLNAAVPLEVLQAINDSEEPSKEPGNK